MWRSSQCMPCVCSHYLFIVNVHLLNLLLIFFQILYMKELWCIYKLYKYCFLQRNKRNSLSKYFFFIWNLYTRSRTTKGRSSLISNLFTTLFCSGVMPLFAFQSFDFEHTRWRLFQKRVVCTKLDIYIFITLV